MAIALVAKLCWVGIGLAIAWLAIRAGIGSFGEPGAGMISAGLGGVIALIGLGGIVRLLSKRGAAEPIEPWTKAMVARIGIVLVLLVAYVALFERVGFLVLTAVLLAILFGFLGGIRWRWAIPLAVVLAASNYALFKLALGTQLAAGILG